MAVKKNAVPRKGGSFTRIGANARRVPIAVYAGRERRKHRAENFIPSAGRRKNFGERKIWKRDIGRTVPPKILREFRQHVKGAVAGTKGGGRIRHFSGSNLYSEVFYNEAKERYFQLIFDSETKKFFVASSRRHL